MLTLKAERWYALEQVASIPIGDAPKFAPAFVEKVIPRKTGQNVLGLQLYTPEGERRWDARVLQRTAQYIVAAIGDADCAILRAVTFDWLGRFCPELAKQHPFPPEPRYPGDVQFYLDQVFGEQVSHPTLARYSGDHLVFDVSRGHFSDTIQATARDCPLTVEAEHLLALSNKVRRYVARYFPGREKLGDNTVLHVEYKEQDVLITCALRFDGYKYLDRVLNGDGEVIRGYIDRGEMPQEPLMQMATFFHLQRYLMKWGGEHEPLHGRAWRLFRTLFLAVAHDPVPLEFQHPEYYASWLHNYEPCRAQAIDAVRRVHETTVYDDDAPPVL